MTQQFIGWMHENTYRKYQGKTWPACWRYAANNVRGIAAMQSVMVGQRICYGSGSVTQLRSSNPYPPSTITNELCDPAWFLRTKDGELVYWPIIENEGKYDESRWFVDVRIEAFRMAQRQHFIEQVKTLGLNVMGVDNMYHEIKPCRKFPADLTSWTAGCLELAKDLVLSGKDLVAGNIIQRYPVICNVACNRRNIPAALEDYSATGAWFMTEAAYTEDTDWDAQTEAFARALNIPGYCIYLMVAKDPARYQKALDLTKDLWNKTHRIFVAG
jgi:hypothetical protein